MATTGGAWDDSDRITRAEMESARQPPLPTATFVTSLRLSGREMLQRTRERRDEWRPD